jgi:DNA-binding CsgD family transcriptional regulator/PAS domain-containing protein
MHVDDDFSRLLGELYEGPLEEQPWATFLASVRDCLGADLVTLLLRPPSQEEAAVMLADGGSLSAMRSYNEGQFVLDPFVDLPSGEVVSLHEFLSTETLLASDFYRIIMQPQGWYDFLGLDIRDGVEMDVRFRVGRYQSSPPFGPGEKSLLLALRPHLERAVRMQARMQRTERERAVYAGAVEQMRVATIILDEQGRVLSTNAAAAELLQQDNRLRLSGDRLYLSDKAVNRELEQLTSAIIQGRGGDAPAPASALQIPGNGASADLGLVIRGVPASGSAEGRAIPSVALFISDPRQAAEPPQQVISRLFGLTPAEAALALLLANGLTLDEAAGQLAVSRNTARAHLRAMFAKTGVARQSGLVRLILQSVAPLASEVAG